MSLETLRASREGPVTWVRFKTKGKYNVVNSKFIGELQDVLRKEQRSDSRLFVLEGEGNFGAGIDLEELYEVSRHSEASNKFLDALRDLFLSLLSLRKITISIVKEMAYGASLELVLLTDLAISSPEAKFSSPGAKWGLFPPVLLMFGPSIMGLRRLNKFLLTGEVVDAQQAYNMGLVDYVASSPEQEFRKLIPVLLRNGPQVVGLMKKIRNRGVEEALVSHMKELSIQLTTDETREGLRAFVFRKSPPWFRSPSP